MSRKKQSVLEGWATRPVLGKDPQGNTIITELHISPISEIARNVGLSGAVLRAISLPDLLDAYLDDAEYYEVELLLYNDDYKKDLEKMRKSIAGPWPATGNKPHQEWMYATVALFFYKCQREDRSKPISLLAELLEIDVKSAARKVDKARQLGLLTRPTSTKKGAPSGKSGGVLTEKALEILNIRVPKGKRKA